MEIHQIDMPVDSPQPGTKVLFDNTHQGRPGAVGDWTIFAQQLTSAGVTVSQHTSGAVTASVLNQHHAFVIAMARVSYTQSEKDAIVDFVNRGGGLLISQDFGNAPWSPPIREILNLFGANDDNNTRVHLEGDARAGQHLHVELRAPRPLIKPVKEDVVTLVNMDQDLEVELTQSGAEIVVHRVYHEAHHQGQGFPGAAASAP